jgi:hypothetical protein
MESMAQLPSSFGPRAIKKRAVSTELCPVISSMKPLKSLQTLRSSLTSFPKGFDN